MNKCLILFSLGALFFSWEGIAADVAAEEFQTQKTIQRIYNHLLIQDQISACEESSQALRFFPDELKLKQAHIKALAKQGDEKALWIAWREYEQKDLKAAERRDLVESLAWGVIEKGVRSSSALIRLRSCLGAYLGEDAKGVRILCNMMADPNFYIRAIALKLAATLRDDCLKDQALLAFRTEPNWGVRLEAIQAIGQMDIKAACPDLMAIISHDETMAEEKAAAIESLMSLLDTVGQKEVRTLAQSKRAGLRQLACEIVTYFELDRDLDQIIPLLQDSQASVRVSALRAIATLRPTTFGGKGIGDYLKPLLDDLDYTVGITAAWVSTLYEPYQGQAAFKKWLNHHTQGIRLLAASALSKTGKYGLELMRVAFQQQTDPYVRMNLAIGLINQRSDTLQACEALYLGLIQLKERWMWDEEAGFQTLKPSTVKYEDAFDGSPEEINQITRLEILNRLAFMKYPKTQEAIRQFLKEKRWGVSGLAATILLTEGDEAAVDIVEELLNDPDPQMKVQAALILAAWGQDKGALATLQEGYPNADRELKEKILEGLCHLGEPSSIPFLLDKLQEPYQSLRIIAASALLRCLYH